MTENKNEEVSIVLGNSEEDKKIVPMSEAKNQVREFLGMEDKDEFNNLSKEALIEKVKQRLKERADANPNEMKLVLHPNKALHTVCNEVTSFTAPFQTFARHLFIFCRRHGGLGLSAPQVGFLHRIVVIDTLLLDQAYGTEYVKNQYPDTLFNPVISEMSGKVRYKEGCLSIPGAYGWVERAKNFIVQYQDKDGNSNNLTVTCGPKDPYGVVLQHEVDHLNGIEFIDKMNFFEKEKVIKGMNRFRDRK